MSSENKLVIKCNNARFIVSSIIFTRFCDYFDIKSNTEPYSKHIFVLKYDDHVLALLIQLLKLPDFRLVHKHLVYRKCIIDECIDLLKLINHLGISNRYLINEVEGYLISIANFSWIDIVIECCNDSIFEHLINKNLSEYQIGRLPNPSYDKIIELKSNEKIYESVMEIFDQTSIEDKRHHQIFKKQFSIKKKRFLVRTGRCTIEIQND